MVKEEDVIRIGKYIFDAEEFVQALGLLKSREVKQYSEEEVEI